MDRTNVLLISTDQHNAEILGCAGNPVVRTPNIDALAAEGVLCCQAFTTFPLCTPARTSIFTGQFAKTHGVRHNVNMNYKPGPPALSPDALAFPQALAKAGYRTALFGKLHARHEGGRNFGLQLAQLVEGKGHFVDAPGKQDAYRSFLLAKGYPEDIWKVWENDPAYLPNGYVTSPFPDEDYIDTFIADMAIGYLDGIDAPFFSWVSFCTPHNPWDSPVPYDRMYDPKDVPMPHRVAGELEKKPARWVDQVARTISAMPATSSDRSLPGGVTNAYARFPEDKTRRMLAAYYGEVSHVDAQIGRVMEVLDRRGLRGNTLVIFCADHGDYLGNNWAFYKYPGLYDSLIRVPFICSWPGTLPTGREVSGLISLADIMPTILEACGLEREAGLMDGRSLMPLLRGEEAAWRDALLVESAASAAVLTTEHKLVRWDDGTEELYDRANDPHDLDNLAIDPATRTIRDGLRERLWALLD